MRKKINKKITVFATEEYFKKHGLDFCEKQAKAKMKPYFPDKDIWKKLVITCDYINNVVTYTANIDTIKDDITIKLG